MTTSIHIQTPHEFWDDVVVPDYDDFLGKIDDLRLALHCAISLFHMADWVYVTHKAMIDAAFTFKDKTGIPRSVSDEKEFANALGDAHRNFELIRQIANTAKHLKLKRVSSHPNAPSHAANTAVQGTGWGQGGFGQGPFGGAPRVMLANHPGQADFEFSDIAESVFKMWQGLRIQHGW